MNWKHPESLSSTWLGRGTRTRIETRSVHQSEWQTVESVLKQCSWMPYDLQYHIETILDSQKLTKVTPLSLNIYQQFSKSQNALNKWLQGLWRSQGVWHCFQIIDHEFHMTYNKNVLNLVRLQHNTRVKLTSDCVSHIISDNSMWIRKIHVLFRT